MSPRLLRCLPTVLAVVALAGAVIAGCGSSSTGGGGSTGSGGIGGSGATGTGGFSTTGSGGSSATGTGGAVGSGGASGGTGAGGTTGTGGSGSVDAGGFGGSGGAGTGTGGAGSFDAGADRPGDGGVVQCSVTIKLVAGGDRFDLPAGPQSKLRVRGLVSGLPAQVEPDWMWSVTLLGGADGGTLGVTTPDPQDRSVMEFPLTTPGQYNIKVTVRRAPACGGELEVFGTFTPSVTYWVRATPPLNRPELPPREVDIRVTAGQAPVWPVVLASGVQVVVEPRRTVAGAATSVPSYVRVSASNHSWLREGDTVAGPFRTSLVAETAPSYNLLVIPLAMGSGPPPAPLLVGPLAATVVGLQDALSRIDDGITVAGTADVAGGAAVAGATVLLRAGDLPSTIGTSNAAGAFAVRARAGQFSALILAPDGAPLPDAQVEAVATGGVGLAVGSPPPALRFSWRAPSATSLVVSYSSSAGGPAAGMAVRIDSQEGAFPDVGTLSVGGVSQVAAGVVHRRGTTDAGGVVTFANLPRGRYTLTALPAAAADGRTLTEVNLSQGPAPSLAVTLARKVEVRGKVMPALAGTRLIVLDDDPELGSSFQGFPTDADGKYVLSLDPRRAYHVLVDPPPGSGRSRVRLGALETGTVDVDQGVRVLPTMLTMTGTVVGPGAFEPMAGALVQVFCLGDGPDCIDASKLSAHDPLPLGEAVVDANGAFRLPVPNPGAN